MQCTPGTLQNTVCIALKKIALFKYMIQATNEKACTQSICVQLNLDRSCMNPGPVPLGDQQMPTSTVHADFIKEQDACTVATC